MLLFGSVSSFRTFVEKLKNQQIPLVSSSLSLLKVIYRYRAYASSPPIPIPKPERLAGAVLFRRARAFRTNDIQLIRLLLNRLQS